MKPLPDKKKRQPLSRERILQAALRLADRKGIPSLSMRTLAAALGVEAMSLYKHVRNKDDLLDQLVDHVVATIELPPPSTPWRDAMRTRARSARRAFLAHPWSATLFESRLRRRTPVRLHYADTVLGLLRSGGFSVSEAYRAFLLLDSYLYGFVQQEISWAVEDEDASREAREAGEQASLDAYPHLAAVTGFVARSGEGGHPVVLSDLFDHGLEIVLDGLEGLRGEGTE
ncbi:MAG: TetR/AcrR family transcriptional regulator C-terminal domain-containing protein [Candidatus Eisenbacteria bacterium]|nr:TetR/AcrR family transcriptional regulator C-terminal domain-containing protein [Candidatus Eisenbacteria bacterium]